ncbi:GNAT family N-acetyltransferase [Ideonella sp. 4Y16]|uniref:GNAT family N-acetyltransferase n=1 Tax=Ideonella alba TaxID=2824118 RepID=UPI001B38E8A2|nr:GNAT family N-acetyltransferase [Ideonella alba]MBQ0941804.1 GNAT family N-acetyltransferase [Ideonella alba]
MTAAYSVTIRRLGPEDAAAHRALMLGAYQREPEAFTSSVTEREHLPLDWWARRLGPAGSDEQVWGAFIGEQLVGAAGLSREARERTAHRGFVFGVAVEPDHRRQGIARRLVRTLMADARTWPGLRLLELTVSDGNASARRVYEDCGFIAWGCEPRALALDDGREIGKWHMQWMLPAPGRRFAFADSEVAAVEPTTGGWRLRFSAAQVAEQRDGVWQAGHLAPVVLVLQTAAPPPALLGRLAEGRLIDAQGRAWRELPLPQALEGALRLELQLARGEAVVIDARSLRLGAPPRARWRESLAC